LTRWPVDLVAVEGEARTWRRVGDEEGSALDFRFCPCFGATVWFTQDDAPDVVAVAVGAFADPGFPAPAVSHYESRKHAWVRLPEGWRRS